MRGLIIAIVAAFLFLFAFLTCHTRIDPSATGIRVDKYGDSKGQPKDDIVSGAFWYNPITTDVYETPNQWQRLETEEISVTTRDGMVTSFDVATRLRVTRVNTLKVFQEERKPIEELLETRVNDHILNAYISAAKAYESHELYTKGNEYLLDVNNILAKTLTADGYTFDKSVITSELTLPGEVRASINATNKKNQEVQQAIADAAKKVQAAKGDSASRVTRAAGIAQAIKLDADARDYANREISKSLTPMLIDYYRNNKWDGKYPQTVSGVGVLKQLN